MITTVEEDEVLTVVTATVDDVLVALETELWVEVVAVVLVDDEAVVVFRVIAVLRVKAQVGEVAVTPDFAAVAYQ
jgi:hypothetical protein